MANVILTDGRNQKELLQTPKNREAHNILNICHAKHASWANSHACKHEHVGPQPFAATPPQHLAADGSAMLAPSAAKKSTLQVLNTGV